MRDLPRPGIELVFPALAGRFFTTETPGKPEIFLLDNDFFFFSGQHGLTWKIFHEKLKPFPKESSQFSFEETDSTVVLGQT